MRWHWYKCGSYKADGWVVTDLTDRKKVTFKLRKERKQVRSRLLYAVETQVTGIEVSYASTSKVIYSTKIWTAVESLQEKSLDSLNPSTCSLLVPLPSWEKRFTPVVGKFGQNKHSGCPGIKGGKVTCSKNSWPMMPLGNKTSEEKSSDSVPFQRRLEWVTEAIRGQETQETVSSAHSRWGTGSGLLEAQMVGWAHPGTSSRAPP